VFARQHHEPAGGDKRDIEMVSDASYLWDGRSETQMESLRLGRIKEVAELVDPDID
jgi:hypothetical protein